MIFTWPGQLEMRKVGIELAQYAVASLGHTADIADFENRPPLHLSDNEEGPYVC